MIYIEQFTVKDGCLPDNLAEHDAAVRRMVLQIYPHIPHPLALHALSGECYIAIPEPGHNETMGIASVREAAPDHVNLPGAAWVHSLVVAPHYRYADGRGSHGVGSKLVRQILTHAKQTGFHRVGLEATVRSIPFWEKQGFEKIVYDNQKPLRTAPMARSL